MSFQPASYTVTIADPGKSGGTWAKFPVGDRISVMLEAQVIRGRNLVSPEDPSMVQVPPLAHLSRQRHLARCRNHVTPDRWTSGHARFFTWCP